MKIYIVNHNLKISFLNPSNLCAAASLWLRQSLSTRRVFLDTATPTSAFDVVSWHLSRCRILVAVEQVLPRYAHGKKGFFSSLGENDWSNLQDPVACSYRNGAIPFVGALRPRRGRLKTWMNGGLLEGGGVHLHDWG